MVVPPVFIYGWCELKNWTTTYSRKCSCCFTVFLPLVNRVWEAFSPTGKVHYCSISGVYVIRLCDYDGLNVQYCCSTASACCIAYYTGVVTSIHSSDITDGQSGAGFFYQMSILLPLVSIVRTALGRAGKFDCSSNISYLQFR